jgi:hypothetical protein
MIRAHNLAVRQADAFVHEIETDEDLRLVMASQYDHCIAALRAASEEMARDRILAMATAVHSPLCDMTFEAVALHP